MTTVTGPVTGPPHAPARLPMTPARWVTLMIGGPIALVLMLGGGLNLVTHIGGASFPVDRTIPLNHGRLVASIDGGDLTVRTGGAGGADGASGSAARLIGTVQYSLVRPDFSVNGTGIHLHCNLFLGNCGLNAKLDVPPRTPLDLSSGGGNMQVSGVQSAVTLTSGGGDVSLSGSGGAATVDSGGGNLSVSHLGGILKLITSGGDVDGSGLTSPKATMDSGGGNVTLRFASPPANLSVISSGGDITILLPRDGTSYVIGGDGGDGGGYDIASTVHTGSSAHTITVKSGGGNIRIGTVS